jgi:hypothetical protein
MAFLVPHYEYDVFVSYSHGVRGSANDMPLKDWTLELIGRLETDIRLDPEFDQLHIWRDAQIDPTIHLSDELRAKVTQSGILMVVMSPRYLGSAWCKDELEWFRRQVEDRRRDQGRVFVVRAWPTAESSWPEFLRDERGHALVGFWFDGASSMLTGNGAVFRHDAARRGIEWMREHHRRLGQAPRFSAPTAFQGECRPRLLGELRGGATEEG